MVFPAAALGAGASLVGSFIDARSKRKQSKAMQQAQQQRIDFAREQLDRTYSSNRGYSGFGNSKDTLTKDGRTESFNFNPNLQSYIDKQGSSLGAMGGFGNVESQMSRLDSGQNPFYNMATDVRNRGFDTALGTMGESMFSRGLGNSSIMGQAVGRLSSMNQQQELADRVGSINQEQGFNSNAQNASFGGLGQMFNYAQGLRGDTLQQRGQMGQLASFQPAAATQSAGAGGKELGAAFSGLGTSGFLGALNKARPKAQGIMGGAQGKNFFQNSYKMPDFLGNAPKGLDNSFMSGKLY